MVATVRTTPRRERDASHARGPLVALGIACLQVLFVFCFSYPVTHAVPHRAAAGAGMLTTLLPLVLTGATLGFVLTLVEPGRVRLAALTIGTAVAAGLGVGAVAHALGVFSTHYGQVAGVLALMVLGLAASAAGLAHAFGPRVGRVAFALLAMVMLFIGIPASGAQVPHELLVQPWRALGDYLPPGAAVQALRGVAATGGPSITNALSVLACWAAGGLALLAVPGRRGHPVAGGNS